MHKLHGKRALVTAGAQGIGLAISRQFLAAGCEVFVHYRSSADAARGLEAEADDAFWTEVMSLNIGSARRVTRAAAPRLIAAAKTGGGASIVNLSSLAGRKGGHSGSLVYSTAKGAILTFTRALASEYDGFITGATLDINGGVYAC